MHGPERFASASRPTWWFTRATRWLKARCCSSRAWWLATGESSSKGSGSESTRATDREPGEPRERVAVGRSGNSGQRFECVIGFVHRESCRVIEAARAFHNGADGVQFIGPALRDRAADQRGALRIAMLQRVNQWQCRLAFGEIGAGVLAELEVVTSIVERVIDELEGDAEVLAVAGE